jgi:hypothetical protein
LFSARFPCCGTGKRQGTGPAACPKICGRQRAGMRTRLPQLEPALPEQPRADTRERSSTYPALGRHGSCRNDPGPRPKRRLPKRYRLLPKRLLPNPHSSRVGQTPPLRVVRSRAGKVPLGRLRPELSPAWTSAEPEGKRWTLSVPDGKGSLVHGRGLARSRTPRRLRGSGYSEACQSELVESCS